MTERKLFSDIQPEAELLPSEIATIETEINKEIERELKAAAKDKLRERLREEARQKRGLSEPMDEVSIDLASYAKEIRINNVTYFHGQTYRVPQSVAMTLREICDKTWAHQAVVEGRNQNFYRQSRRASMSMATGAVTGMSGLMRA